MTVLFVLATLIAFLTADHFVQKTRLARAAAPAGAETFMPVPADVMLALNHTWVKKERPGVFTVGLDEFLVRVLGSVENVILPQVGAAAATAGIMLRQGNKSLPLSAPVSGRVVAVNENVIRDPGLFGRDPYGNGWLVKVEAQGAGVGETIRSTEAAAWLKKQTALAREFLLGQMGTPKFAMMQDGGAPAAGALNECDQAVWEEFARRFTLLQHGAPHRPTN